MAISKKNQAEETARMAIPHRLAALEKKHGLNSKQMAAVIGVNYESYIDQRNGRSEKSSRWKVIALKALETFGVEWLRTP